MRVHVHKYIYNSTLISIYIYIYRERERWFGQTVSVVLSDRSGRDTCSIMFDISRHQSIKCLKRENNATPCATPLRQSVVLHACMDGWMDLCM